MAGPSPEEIRELRAALKWYEDEARYRSQTRTLRLVVEAARLYADLLENGQRKRAEQRELSVMPWVLVVPGPGRYLVVPVQEEIWWRRYRRTSERRTTHRGA